MSKLKSFYETVYEVDSSIYRMVITGSGIVYAAIIILYFFTPLFSYSGVDMAMGKRHRRLNTKGCADTTLWLLVAIFKVGGFHLFHIHCASIGKGCVNFFVF